MNRTNFNDVKELGTHFALIDIADAHIDDCCSCIPGHAFREGIQFLEQHDFEFMRGALNETQRRFYEVREH